jgi:hypothetical protein
MAAKPNALPPNPDTFTNEVLTKASAKLAKGAPKPKPKPDAADVFVGVASKLKPKAQGQLLAKILKALDADTVTQVLSDFEQTQPAEAEGTP